MRFKFGRYIEEWVYNAVIDKIDRKIDVDRSRFPYPSTSPVKVVSAQLTQVTAGVSGRWLKWDQLIIADLSNVTLSDTLVFYDGGSGGSALFTAFIAAPRMEGGDSALACGLDERRYDIKGIYIVSGIWCSTTLARWAVNVGGIMMSAPGL